MQLAPTKAGLSPERLEWITDHLTRHYIDPGKIAGCQTLVARRGHAAYFRSLGFLDLERHRPMGEREYVSLADLFGCLVGRAEESLERSRLLSIQKWRKPNR
jgi:CubicO group peptidase (beta-lactamase class C family)